MNNYNSDYITEDLVHECIKLFRSGYRKIDVARYIMDETGLRLTQGKLWSKRIYEDFIESIPDESDELYEIFENHGYYEDEENPGFIKYTDKYAYNPLTEDYLIYTRKKYGENIHIKKSLVDEILKRYSDYDGEPATKNQLASKFEISRRKIDDIINAFNTTHDDNAPITPEQMLLDNERKTTEDLIQEKKSRISRKLEKHEWNENTKYANTYRQIKYGRFDPFKEFVTTYDFNDKERFNFNKKELDVLRNKDKVYVIGISDTHYGNRADGDKLYHGEEWNIEKTNIRMNEYLHLIKDDVDSRNYPLPECYVLVLGDILDSLNGFTDKGTPLITNPIGYKLWKETYKSLKNFIDGLNQIFMKINIKVVGGNHFNFGDKAIFFLFKEIFSEDERIEVEIADGRWMNFRIMNNFFIMEHGASSEIKSKVPKGEKQRMAYISTLMLEKPELLVGTTHKYFITADQHSFIQNEMPHFDFIQFSTFVGGDEYANENNLINIPRQNALVLEENGIRDTRHFHFHKT